MYYTNKIQVFNGIKTAIPIASSAQIIDVKTNLQGLEVLKINDFKWVLSGRILNKVNDESSPYYITVYTKDLDYNIKVIVAQPKNNLLTALEG